MSENLVSFEIDWENPPTLTAEQEERLARLAERSDEEIDYSDAPSLPDEMWEKGERGRFYRGTKPAVPVALAGDVLAWFRRQSDDYVNLIDQVLRREMNAQKRAAQQTQPTALEAQALKKTA